MKEIAWGGLVDRSGWARGPWDRELADKVQWKDRRTASPCLAVRNITGVWCGYVGVTTDHPTFTVHWRLLSGLRVHCGIDYSGFCNGNVCHVTESADPHPVWWLGFATARNADLRPACDTERYKRPYDATSAREYRSLAYVKQQCASLAQQLADVAAGLHRPSLASHPHLTNAGSA
jgi:hypothetical protein